MSVHHRASKADTPPFDSNEPVKIELDPETALRALLAVDPDSKPANDANGTSGTERPAGSNPAGAP